MTNPIFECSGRLMSVLLLLLAPAFCASTSGEDASQPVKIENVSPAGRFVEVTIPDTLDLAARAELSINALTRNLTAC